jgi:hypothetical protein
MGCVYVVMACEKFENKGYVSSDCYSTLEAAQEFCASRYEAKKVGEMYWSSSTYDYKIHVLNLK